MLAQANKEQVLWMADCYSLAKRFSSATTWMSLLEPTESTNKPDEFNAFDYWLWMEIWKAAQNNCKHPQARTLNNE